MKFDQLGNVNVDAWDIAPDYGEATDGSFMVFKAAGDEDMVLYVSNLSSMVQLHLRRDSEWDTYSGVSTDAEREALATIYYGGDHYVKPE